MIRIEVTNKFSNYSGRMVQVDAKHWAGDSFWVPVLVDGKLCMAARSELV
jgi:hypothetical protein